MDAVILCGGEGTRIRHLLPEGTPKCMADINGTPFLELLLAALAAKDIRGQVILCTGYGHDMIWNYYCWSNSPHKVWLSEEKQSSGTGGAIKKALLHGKYLLEDPSDPVIQSDPFFIFNGDTICDVDCGAMLKYHETTNSTVTIACDKDFRHVGAFIASRRFIDFIPPDCNIDMAEVFTLLDKAHEPVGCFITDAPFYDIGDKEGLETFRAYWASKGEKDARQSLYRGPRIG